MRTIPAVVIRASDHCFLDVIRALALEQIPVLPVVFTWEGAAPWIGESSCFFHDPVTIVNPAEDEEKAAQELEALGEKLHEEYGRKLLLITTSDTALVFVNRHYKKLEKYFLQMGGPDFQKDCWWALKKDLFARIMEENDVPIPQTIPVLKSEQIRTAVNAISYPCIYKPTIKDSGNTFQRTHNGRKAVECADREALCCALEKDVAAGFPLIVQEKIEFDTLEDEVSCYVYSDVQGNIRMISAQHKLYEYPAKYGTGVVSRLYFQKELAETAIKTVKAIGWHGFVGVELMRNRKTGKWLVIEANLRPWLSNYFQAAAGFNYLALLYRDAMEGLEAFQGTKTPSVQELYRVDLGAFINKHMKEMQDPDKAFSEVIQFLKKHLGKVVFSYSVAQDPEPGEKEIEYLQTKYPEQQGYLSQIAELVGRNNQQFLQR